VGRRLWRRRKRRSDDDNALVGSSESAAPAGGAGNGASAAAGNDNDNDNDNDADPGARDDEGVDADLPGPAPPSTKPGFFARLFGWGRSPSPPRDEVVVDPLVEIHALPRGVARLDAFTRTLGTLAAGSALHRRVALALDRELERMSREAGIDLAVFEPRVVACAEALIAAHEVEKAGDLLARLGRRGQAADLFVQAGAIDALEEQHAKDAWEGGGARLDASLAFRRFEALFSVGLRDDALVHLERACALWDNPVYAEVLAGFRARIPGASLTLSCGDDVIRIVAGLPVRVGRGEDCGVRVDSPLVSRVHVEIGRQEQALCARDLVSAGGTDIDGHPLTAPRTLAGQGTLTVSGVALDYDVDEQRLRIHARLRPRHVTVVLLGDVADDALLGAPVSGAGGRLRLVACSQARLNADAVRKDALLLIGDRITVGARTFVVVGR
jgi:tetratricopeptide (TPR) repeat protein